MTTDLSLRHDTAPIRCSARRGALRGLAAGAVLSHHAPWAWAWPTSPIDPASRGQ